MKPSIAFVLLTVLLTACGTRPPQPAQCEGPLAPINAPVGALRSGAANAP